MKFEVPADWANAADAEDDHDPLGHAPTLSSRSRTSCSPLASMDGDSLPVSAFLPHVDGQFELGAAAYEKRGVCRLRSRPGILPSASSATTALMSAPMPPSVPFALTEEEAAKAPAAAKIVDVKAGKGKGVYQYTMAVSPLDCMGCGVCVGVCPVKALTMVGQEEETRSAGCVRLLRGRGCSQGRYAGQPTVKGSQFKQPYLEFSGSCAGCAETSYARLVTQLFGDRMYISNATGCSSIWGGPAATSPYCTDKNGHGPAWCQLPVRG